MYSELGQGHDLQGVPAARRAVRACQPDGCRGPRLRPLELKPYSLVEDEDAVRLLTRRVLEEASYRVFDAPNPQQAEAIFDANPNVFSLLVTDVIMPGSTAPSFSPSWCVDSRT